MKRFHVLLSLLLLVLPGTIDVGARPQVVAEAGYSLDGRKALPESLAFKQALQLAVRNSPVIAGARERIREQEGVVIEARAGLRPSFELASSYDFTDPERIESFGPGVTPLDQSWRSELLVTYTIYNGGRDRANTRAAQAAKAAARNRLGAVVDTVMLEVALRYFDALLASDQIAVQEKALAVLREQLEDATSRFDAGTGPQFNVLQAEVALANARPPLVRARSRKRLALDQLRRAIGMDYPAEAEADEIELTSRWPEDQVRETLEGSLRRAFEERPELVAAAADIEAARERYRAELALTRPRVEAVAGYGLQSESFGSSATSALAGWTAGLRVSIPLFDTGSARGRRLQADSRIRQSELGEEELRLQIEGEVREAWLSLDEAREILDSSQLVVQQAEEALRLARNSFDAGTVTQLQVLQSQLELTRAESEEIAAQHLFHTAMARLRRAMGSLSGSDGQPPPGN